MKSLVRSTTIRMLRRVMPAAACGTDAACRNSRSGLSCTHIRLIVLMLLVAAFFWGCGPSMPIVEHKGKDVSLVVLHGGLNTSSEEFAPQLSPDGSLLYFTSRRAGDGAEDGTDKLYAAALEGMEVRSVRRVQTGLDRTLAEGAPSFDHSGSRVYFSQCYAADGFGDCDLYTADVVDGEWRNVRNMGSVVNSKDWDCHPAISHDGRTLYFASERDGGAGGSDIWMTRMKADGSWSAPVNLGPPVNTKGDEKTPFISDDGVLYFSSDYHDGYGGLDLFMSRSSREGWSQPLNMGLPYNSPSDDLFLTTRGNADTVFVASDRPNGYGGFDLYGILRVPVAPPPPPGVPAAPLRVRYVARNAYTGAEIEAFVTLTSDGREPRALRAGGAGEAVDIDAGRGYTADITRSGFESSTDSFRYADDVHGTQTRTVDLIPIVEKERVIYSFLVEFDFNYSNIRESERRQLDSVVVLLARWPNSTVVLSGHTDSVGTIEYNIRLGYNRAKEVGTYVERYLREQHARIEHPFEIRTYGESQPVASNESDEGRQRNRRVEISIVRNE